MNAIVTTVPNHLEWQKRPMPQPLAGQVRIRTLACGICATDLEMIAGWERTGFPAIPGHEWSGVVDAIGPQVDGALLGRRCVGENVWTDGGEVGFEHPGGYGQFFLTEAANVHLLPNGLPAAEAALIEPLAVCVRGLRRLSLQGPGTVLIFGDGPIGLLTLALLKLDQGRSVILVGGRPARLRLAREFGADEVLNYHECDADLAGEIRRLNGLAFPFIVEASGSSTSLAASLDLASIGGKILVLGDYGHARAEFPWNRLLHRELELIGSNASAGAWPEAMRLATSGAIPLHRLTSRCLPASSFAEAMAEIQRNRDLVKVILDWTAYQELETGHDLNPEQNLMVEGGQAVR